MTRPQAKVGIVGGGLSGLCAAYLLQKAGITDFVVLEARTAPGGRVMSVPLPDDRVASPQRDVVRYDLGAAWFWPGIQPELDRLIRELDVTRLPQHESGDMLIERAVGDPPVRIPGFTNAPVAMRLIGGMAALIDALRDRLPPDRIQTGTTVRRVHATDTVIEIEADDVSGATVTWCVDHLMMAVPPRVASARIAFSPPLPPSDAARWRATETWMAPHAKYLAVYETPFWRAHGLSGEARSVSGPLAEIHDASGPAGRGALFGFLGLPAALRERVTTEALRAECRAQLVRLFGPEASTPLLDVIKDWTADPLTATDLDRESRGDHGGFLPAGISGGPWRDRLTGIASEWSRRYPGYLAGALDGAMSGVARVSEFLPSAPPPAILGT